MPESFWTEAQQILGIMLSADCRLQVEEATKWYTFDIDHSLSASKTAKACSKLVKAMDQFRRAYQSVLDDPKTGAHIKKTVTDDSARGATDWPNWLDDQWWRHFDGVRERLLDEKKECEKIEFLDSPENKPWIKWVRRLADILRKEGFAVTVRSYESRYDRRRPTPFVEFITLLQAQLPPDRYERHEPARAGHKYFAINKAIQRALRDSNQCG
jgi:hypothetical protein